MRENCYTCFRPKSFCLCPKEQPLQTKTHIVILMHVTESKRIKSNTGRLTSLCFANSEIIIGHHFDDNKRVNEILSDSESYPVLLYPGKDALNISCNSLHQDMIQNKRLVVFILDATWSTSRTMLRLTPRLSTIPKIMFTSSQKSRYVNKMQPNQYCLSTLEAVHELFLALESSELDVYEDKTRLLSLFDAMQNCQIEAFKNHPNPRKRKSKTK